MKLLSYEEMIEENVVKNAGESIVKVHWAAN